MATVFLIKGYEKMTTLAQLVRRARDAKGWSQDELAERVGRSKGWVGQLETGKIARPRPEYLELLARELDITREDIARAMGMLDPQNDLDVLAELRRLRNIHDSDLRAEELRRLPPELYEMIEWLAMDMVRQTFEQARE